MVSTQTLGHAVLAQGWEASPKEKLTAVRSEQDHANHKEYRYMTRYSSDYLDEACTEMYGHTNWEYGDGDANKTVVIFHKEPLDDDEDYDD